MRSAGQVVAAALVALGAAGASSGLHAQAGLGNAAADAAVAALKARAGAQIVCEIQSDFVVCTGLRTGDCLAEGWLISHDGSTCRKKLE